MSGKLVPSVCIDAVLEGQAVDDALRLVSDCKMPAFEFWCWWEKDLDQLCRARDRFGLKIASCCTKFISLVDPNLRDDYLKGLGESIEAAKQIDCQVLISQVGDFIPDVKREAQHDSLVEGLRQAAELLASSGITLVIEPLNEKVNHAGYYLIRSDEAFEIVDKVNSPNIKVVFDIYHQQISEGDLIQNIVPNIDKIGHFHAAGNPGRNELTRGEINYPEILRAIELAGYEGFVGLEYWPVDDPETGLRTAAAMFG